MHRRATHLPRPPRRRVRVPEPTAVPREVRSWGAELRKVGLQPVYEQLSQRLWRISVTTAHAAMYIDLKRTPAGTWRWADSEVTVDGRPHPVADDASALAAIFRR